MEIVYCSRCGRQVPPGGIYEGRYYLVADEPVCMDCAEGMSESELTASTILKVPTEERDRKRPTTKLVARVGAPDHEEPPPEMLDTMPGSRGSGRAARLAVLLLFLAAAVAVAVTWMRGGSPELPPPPEQPASTAQPQEGAPATLSPEIDGFFRPAGRSKPQVQGAFVSQKGTEEYCLRFNLSEARGPVREARLVLHVIWHNPKVGGFRPQLSVLKSDAWSSDGVRWADRPVTGTDVARVPVSKGSVEVDVTAAVNAALRDDRRLSLRLYAGKPVAGGGGRVKFATLAAPEAEQRPRLKLTY